jgi:arylsulfatase A-like enzyme
VDYPHYDYVDGYLTDAELKHCRALYAAEVTLVDRWVGKLFDRIRDLNLLDNTMVLFTADHGFLHGEHGIIGKSMLSPRRPWGCIPIYNEISHIPFVLRFPRISPGRSDAMVQPPDIMPSILEAGGVEIPETVQGKSFLPVVRGEAKEHRPRAFSFSYVDRPDAIATITEGKWQGSIRPTKVKIRGDDVTLNVDGLPKPVVWNPEENETPLLYDIEADPQQTKNLAAKNPQVVAKLRERFVELLIECEADSEVVDAWKEEE